MQLILRNLAKVAKANIAFHGITVIAGANNTGKSTVGKALYAMFRSFHQMGDAILWHRWSSIADAILQGARAYDPYAPAFLRAPQRSERLVAAFLADHCTKAEDFLRTGERFVQQEYRLYLSADSERRADIGERIARILALDEAVLAQHIVDREFSTTFGGQINSLANAEPAEVRLRIQKKDLHVQFSEDRCRAMERPVSLMHQAVYIDAPDALDHFDDALWHTSEGIPSDLSDRLRKEAPSDTVAEALNQQALQKVMDVLDRTVPGRLEEAEGHLYLRQKHWRAPLRIENLSAGMKAFAVPKRLLQNRQLGERDVLILDEPEIHLHPEWQVLYAEFLVLLQKAFDLTILLTSHSPYFLNAMEIFVKKHDVEALTRYYLAKNQVGGAVFEDVTGRLDAIYASLARPFDQMEAMEEELGMMEG